MKQLTVILLSINGLKKKPSVKNLRVFGSECFVHIPNEQRTKWEENSVKCIMVGYSEGNKAYRVYNQSTRKLMIRRDVIFNENVQQEHVVTEKVEKEEEMPNDCEKREESTSSTHEYKNPRLPIPRSPYPKRTKSRIDDEKKEEQAVIAEVFMASAEPQTYAEAMETDDAEKWKEAINDELNSLKVNNTWILVDRPKNTNIVTNRWIFKRKLKANGEIDCYKARLVARGCSQKYGIDYEETFSPVAKFDSVRTLIAMGAAKGMKILQFDVKTAFLHGHLIENIYMEQPSGCVQDSGKVCLLKKALYGLKQASRQWNAKFVNFIVKCGFV